MNKKYFKELQWHPEHCKDDENESIYFNNLIKFLEKEFEKNQIVWKRNWSESFTEEEIKDCKKRCYKDPFSPSGSEVQYVLGRKNTTKCYNSCLYYPVLNIKDYSIYLNDIFIMYILKKQRKQINHGYKVHDIFPIRIVVDVQPIDSLDISYVIPDHKLMKDEINIKQINKIEDPVKYYNTSDSFIKKYSSDVSLSGNLTAREMCILYTSNMKFYLAKKENQYYPFILVSSYDINYIKEKYPKQIFEQIFL